MIECIPRPIHVKNNLASLWGMGAEAAEGVYLNVESDRRCLYYRVSAAQPCKRRWSSATLSLAEESFPITNDRICEAIEHLTGDDGGAFEKWFRSNASYKRNCGRYITSLTRSYSSTELDMLLSYQAIAFGFWYRLLEDLVVTDYMQKGALLAGIWGAREQRVLNHMQYVSGILRRQSQHRITRVPVLRMMAMMFAGRSGPTETESINDEFVPQETLVAILGDMSIACISLLKVPKEPQDCKRFAIMNCPILDLFGDQDGLLYSDGDGTFAYGPPNEPVAASFELTRKSFQTPEWSVRPKVNFSGHHVRSVHLIARCNGIPCMAIGPHYADIGFLSNEHHHDKTAPSVQNNSPPVKIKGVEITEMNIRTPGQYVLESHRCTEKHVQIFQTAGAAILRYQISGYHCSPRHPQYRLLCGSCDLKEAVEALPKTEKGDPWGMLIL
ncbi:hypothetical protein K402DRAFT_179914 [Aulographum hederae CBS 113979]|uniref:Uncharacterized protein n=1 Tax=Aulographum hederae CBS 113979 TaxID=1176131 RepID=A0A6G1GQI4_9PEZI|nr:hypothetical protein K402DRAFT_179914 [Aulographum hederae CBS 113979]